MNHRGTASVFREAMAIHTLSGSGGLAVARSERGGMPASDEHTATVAPFLSLALPDVQRVPHTGGGATQGARPGEGEDGGTEGECAEMV